MERNEKEQQPPKQCPRCESMNTKFCYYNNYSQSQPRHFCRACRRYWTEGGALRNVPQGGGSSRKAKRQKKSATTAPKMPVAPISSGPASKGIAILPAGPEGALPLAPPAPPYYLGDGTGEGLVGLQGGNQLCFHPGAGGIAGDMRDQSPMMPLMLPPGYINFPVPHQEMQNLLPPPGTMIDPVAPPSISRQLQQVNTATNVFAAAAISRQQLQMSTAVNVSTAAGTTGPSVSAAGAYDGGEEIWNVFGSGVGGVLPPK